MFRPALRLDFVVLIVALLASCSCARQPPGPLTSIGQVAALPSQISEPRPQVALNGWVTLADLNLIFIEDGTGAARVDLPLAQTRLAPGDYVFIRGGVAEAGASPSILATEVTRQNGRHVVQAMKMSAGDLLAGAAGFRFVEIEGVLRSTYIDRAGRVILRVGSGGTVLEARLNSDVEGLPREWRRPGRRVRVRAVTNPRRDLEGRVMHVQLWVPALRDLIRLEPPPATLPVITVGELKTRTRKSLPDEMLHLRGGVQYEGPKNQVSLRDQSGSLRLRPGPGSAVVTGESVDVFGFAEASDNTIELADTTFAGAMVERTPSPAQTVLTSIRQVHAISPEEALRSIPVRLRARVTFINPVSGLLFLQDESGPTFAHAPRISEFRVKAGDLVEVTGVTAPGDFAPIITNTWVEPVASSAPAMPAPANAAFDDLFSGSQDSAWVETEGIVQGVETSEQPENQVWLEWGDHRYRINVANPASRPLPPADSRVRVQGVCATLFNARRQILGIQLYVPSPDFVRVIEPAPDPARVEIRTINQLLRFSPGDSPGHRVRARGIVTLATPTGPSYIQDAGAGLKIVNHELSAVQPGALVDVLGFTHAGTFSPEMRDARIVQVERVQPVSPARITADEAMEGAYDSALVQIDAVLVDQITTFDRNSLVLQSGGKLFSATLEHGRIPLIQRDSLVRVTGLFSVETTSSFRVLLPKSFVINLRNPDDLKVLKGASWWTAGRLLTLLGSLAALILAVLTWVVVLRRRVRLQTTVIRKKLEQEAALKQAAEQANRAKSEFLANMSHEIRTPLNGVLGFTELMASGHLEEKQREYNEAVRSSAESLLVVINDILDFSRIEAGRLELHSVDFSIRQCAAAAFNTIQPLAVSKGLELSIDVADEIPDWVRSDPFRLRQILVNLAGNAVKFTSRGRISLRVTMADAVASGIHVQFAVADTGIGIPEAQQAAIFEPFRQADGSVTRRFGGSGLGLSISSKLVSMLNGRMWLESQQGVGSTFFFTAVLHEAISPPPVDTPNEEPPSCQLQRPLSILVAEDNNVNQRLIRGLLEMRGHQVTIAQTGSAAIETWRAGNFDLILMDVQMPDVDGLEATRRIRSEENLTGGHVPIIAMTACAMKGDREACLAAGLDAYLSKPVRVAELDSVLAGCGSTVHPADCA